MRKQQLIKNAVGDIFVSFMYRWYWKQLCVIMYSKDLLEDNRKGGQFNYRQSKDQELRKVKIGRPRTFAVEIIWASHSENILNNYCK